MTPGATTTRPGGGRLAAVALAASSALVASVAGVFDVLAGQRPDHTLTLLVVAGAVGLVRWLLRGRLRGFFTLVNLAVVARPVAHGVAKLTRSATGSVPPSHVLPENLVVLAVQVVVALLVVAVAGSEPIIVFVGSAALAAVVLRRAVPPPAAAPCPVEPVDDDDLAARLDTVVRCRPHRGPPALLPAG